MLRDLLTLKTVQVVRKTITNSQGEQSVSSTTLTLARAAIWSTSQSQRYISDKMARDSSHILITLPGDYTFTTDDSEVLYGGMTFRISSPSENVAELDKMIMTGLEKIL